jgi:glucose/arabinose dehydrogenase
VLKEIFVYGFKNPHCITWSQSGEILVSNIGEANVESLNLVMPGHDYGWPIREGSFALDPFGDLTKVYPLPGNDSAYRITYPVVEYGHDSGWTAIAGGYEYLGSKMPFLRGKFVFGDIPSGRLFFVEMTDLKQGQRAAIKEFRIVFNGIKKTLKELCGNDRVDLHFGKDREGPARRDLPVVKNGRENIQT